MSAAKTFVVVGVLLGFHAMATREAIADAKGELKVVSKLTSDGKSTLLFLTTTGSRVIRATVQEDIFQNRQPAGSQKKVLFVHPGKEEYMGSPNESSTGVSVSYKVVAAEYAN